MAALQGSNKGRTSAIQTAIPIPHVEVDENVAHQVPSTFNELCEGTMGLDIPDSVANLGVPLAKSVPLNIRKKWANKFFELGALLRPKFKLSKVALDFVLPKDSNKVWALKTETQDIRNIEDWTNCFHIIIGA